MKKIIATALTVCLIAGSAGSVNVRAATKIKLSTKKTQCIVGKTVKVKVKGVSKKDYKKLKWKIIKGKKNIKIKKKKNYLKITGKKSGTSKVQVTYKKKKYKCTVYVIGKLSAPKKQTIVKPKTQITTPEKETSEIPSGYVEDIPEEVLTDIYAGYRSSDQTLVLGHKEDDISDCTTKYGEVSQTYVNQNTPAWFKDPWLKVQIKDDIYPESTSHWFDTSGNATTISKNKTISGLENLDTTSTKDMSFMFKEWMGTSPLELEFRTQAVKNMDGMFFHTNVPSINLGAFFNTSSVNNMSSMFGGCKSQTLLLGNQFYTSNVETMYQMFAYMPNLKELDLGEHFDTSACEDMSEMFKETGKNSARYINLGNKLSFEKCASASQMFSGCGQNVRTVYVIGCKSMPSKYLDNVYFKNAFTNLNANDMFVVNKQELTIWIQGGMNAYDKRNFVVLGDINTEDEEE